MESGKKSIIRPYVSKRKRNLLQSEEHSEVIPEKKKDFRDENYIQRLFLSDETVLHFGAIKSKNTFPRSVAKTIRVCRSPLWCAKWCRKFSHLIACTAENSLSLYDVMKKDSPICVYTSSHHNESLRDLDWSRTSRQVITCAFDRTLKILDFLNGCEISQTISLPEIPAVVRWNPEDGNQVVVGGHNAFLALYDIRNGKKAVDYKSDCGNVIAMDFLPGRGYFVAAGDAVSRQSPEHCVVVWDTRTGAKMSSQIFHERYSCPALRVHPSGSMFLAQTNGNYIARFSSYSPFRLDRCMRYECHCVEGYPVGFDLSPDGAIVASGSSNGSLCCYKYTDGSLLKTVELPSLLECQKLTNYGDAEGCSVVSVEWHPVLPSMLAVTDWSGRLHLLR